MSFALKKWSVEGIGGGKRVIGTSLLVGFISILHG